MYSTVAEALIPHIILSTIKSCERCTLLRSTSDDAQSTDSIAGYGFVVHQHGETLLSASNGLGSREALDNQTKGAPKGLTAASFT